MGDERTAAEMFEETVEDANRVVEGRPLGVQRLNEKYTLYFDDGGEDAVLVNLDEDGFEKLLNQMQSVSRRAR